MDDTSGPLAGYTVGITAERRREEFAAALARQGATVISGPAIQIVPLVDDRELLAATRRALAAPLDIVVATTGVGFRGWMEAAGQWDLAGPLTAAVDQSVVLARGPKVRGAIRAAGLRETWSPESESSAEVLEHLLADYDLAGKRIAVAAARRSADRVHRGAAPGRRRGDRGAGLPLGAARRSRAAAPADRSRRGRGRRRGRVHQRTGGGELPGHGGPAGPGRGRAGRAGRPGAGRLRRPGHRRSPGPDGDPRRPAQPEPPRRPGQGDRRATPPPQRAPAEPSGR